MLPEHLLGVGGEGRQTVLAARDLGKSDVQLSGHEPQSTIRV